MLMRLIRGSGERTGRIPAARSRVSLQVLFFSSFHRPEPLVVRAWDAALFRDCRVARRKGLPGVACFAARAFVGVAFVASKASIAGCLSIAVCLGCLERGSAIMVV